jgi:hypothetical protein
VTDQGSENFLDPGSCPDERGLGVRKEGKHPFPELSPLARGVVGSKDKAAMEVAHIRAIPTHLLCFTAETGSYRVRTLYYAAVNRYGTNCPWQYCSLTSSVYVP